MSLVQIVDFAMFISRWILKSCQANKNHYLSENLFKLLKWQDCFGVRLSEICSQVGSPLSARFPVIFWSCLQPMWSENSQLRTTVAVCESSLIIGKNTDKKSKHTIKTLETESPSWRKSKSVCVCSTAARKMSREASPTKSSLF